MKIRLEFGLLAPPFREQLRAQGARPRRDTAGEIELCQKNSTALSHLTMCGIITEAVRDSARRKILMTILRCCAPRATEKP